jgi:hypothetical protein
MKPLSVLILFAAFATAIALTMAFPVCGVAILLGFRATYLQTFGACWVVAFLALSSYSARG